MSTASDDVYVALRRDILTGIRGMGQRIGELEVSQELGVSRTPVREALRRLEADGLVEIAPQRGARVISPGPAELGEIFDLREQLESSGAAAAAVRITPDQLAELSDLADLMVDLAAAERTTERVLRRTEANSRFHDLVLVASGRPRQRTIVAELMLVPIVLGTFGKYTDRELRRSSGHHVELVEALAAGDARWASSVMCSHIRAARHVSVRTTHGGRDRAAVPLNGDHHA